MQIKPNEVVLINNNGDRRVFDRDTEAQLALRQGYRNETREEYEERLTKERLSSPVEQVKSFVAGAARGASFGISDVVLSRADEQARKSLELRKEVSPGASIAGEIAGALVGSKVGVGKALARGAESIAARATGGIASSLLRKTLKTAISEGAEGAAYGLGQTISEEALDSDPGINAERLVANVGIGSLLGVAGGGFLGLAGGVAGKAGAAIRGGEKATGDDWLRATVEKYTRSSAAKSLGAEPSAFKKLAKRSKTFEESVDELGEFLSKEKTADGKHLVEKWDNPEKIYEKVRTYKSQIGKQIGDYHESLYEISGDSAVNIDGFFKRADEIIGKRESSLLPELNQRAENLRKIVDKARYIDGPDGSRAPRQLTLRDVDVFRKDIDSIVYQKAKPGTGIVQAHPMKEELGYLARTLQDDITKHIEKIAKPAGAEGKALIAAYRDLNRKFSFLSNAEKIGERGVMRGFSNRAFSPSDYLTAIGGSASGAAAFGPVGIPIGVGVGVVNKILRERSRATITAIGRWALTKESALSSATRTQAKIEKAARGIIKNIKPKPGLLAGITYAKATKRSREDEIKEYRRVQNKIARIAGDQNGLFEDMRNKTASLSDAMPNLGQASQTKMVEVLNYLAAKMPKEGPVDPLRPKKDTAPAIQDVRRFMSLIEIANNPSSILDRMSDGRMPTVDEMDFLRACFPLVAQDITRAITESLERHSGDLGYQQRLNIARLIGIKQAVSPKIDSIKQIAQQEEQQKKNEFKLTASASKQLGKSIEKRAEGVIYS
jgi:hypothetical protein